MERTTAHIYQRRWHIIKQINQGKAILIKKYVRAARLQIRVNKPSHDKINKMTCAPSEDSISLCVRTVLTESSLSAWQYLGPLATPECTAKTLIRLSRCPGWSESSLGVHAILLVLSWDSSLISIRLTDQSLHGEGVGPSLHTQRPEKTLIKGIGWAGWSEFSSGAQFIWQISLCSSSTYLK